MNNWNKNKSWQKQIDKLLFLFASLYLMIILGWQWKNKQPSTTDNVDNNQTIAQQRVDENKLLKNQPTDANIINQNEAKELVLSIPLPEIKEISNSPISNSTITNTTTPNIQKSSSANLNNNIPLPPLPPPPTNLIQQQPQPISSPSPPKKIVSSPKKLAKVPTLKSLNDSTEEKETETINPVPSESSPRASKNIEKLDYTYSLVGVVQLPESDGFALFKINELTEKISVGSEIGTSGWVLMAINGNQAVISSENKSVNIRVGETF